MGAFDKFIKNNNKQPKDKKEIKYDIINRTNDKISNIIELSKILTNNDSQMVEDITMLSDDFDGFVKAHKEWCVDLGVANKDDQFDILNAFAFWLCGHDNDRKVFGAYIDWKEEMSEVVLWLKDVVDNLGYSVNFDALVVDDKMDTFKALQKIDEFLKKSDYTLFTLDIGNDCYHLFITTIKDFDRVKSLGDEIGFSFGL